MTTYLQCHLSANKIWQTRPLLLCNILLPRLHDGMRNLEYVNHLKVYIVSLEMPCIGGEPSWFGMAVRPAACSKDLRRNKDDKEHPCLGACIASHSVWCRCLSGGYCLPSVSFLDVYAFLPVKSWLVFETHRWQQCAFWDLAICNNNPLYRESNSCIWYSNI